MPSWMQSLLQKCRYRLTHTAKFPKGDLVSFLLNVAERGFTPTHIIDVGANQAKWSAKAARIFPRCDFTLVEPQHEMRAQIDRFCMRHPRARWIQAGAADEAGELLLTINPDTVSSTFTMSKEEAESSGMFADPGSRCFRGASAKRGRPYLARSSPI